MSRPTVTRVTFDMPECKELKNENKKCNIYFEEKKKKGKNEKSNQEIKKKKENA